MVYSIQSACGTLLVGMEMDHPYADTYSEGRFTRNMEIHRSNERENICQTSGFVGQTHSLLSIRLFCPFWHLCVSDHQTHRASWETIQWFHIYYAPLITYTHYAVKEFARAPFSRCVRSCSDFGVDYFLFQFTVDFGLWCVWWWLIDKVAPTMVNAIPASMAIFYIADIKTRAKADK